MAAGRPRYRKTKTRGRGGEERDEGSDLSKNSSWRVRAGFRDLIGKRIGKR